MEWIWLIVGSLMVLSLFASIIVFWGDTESIVGMTLICWCIAGLIGLVLWAGIERPENRTEKARRCLEAGHQWVVVDGDTAFCFNPEDP